MLRRASLETAHPKKAAPPPSLGLRAIVEANVPPLNPTRAGPVGNRLRQHITIFFFVVIGEGEELVLPTRAFSSLASAQSSMMSRLTLRATRHRKARVPPFSPFSHPGSHHILAFHSTARPPHCDELLPAMSRSSTRLVECRKGTRKKTQSNY